MRVTTGTRFGLRHRWEWLRLGQLGRCPPPAGPGLQLQQDSADRRPRLAGSTSLLHPGPAGRGEGGHPPGTERLSYRGTVGPRAVSLRAGGVDSRQSLPSALRPVPGRAVVPLLHAPGPRDLEGREHVRRHLAAALAHGPGAVEHLRDVDVGSSVRGGPRDLAEAPSGRSPVPPSPRGSNLPRGKSAVGTLPWRRGASTRFLF